MLSPNFEGPMQDEFEGPDYDLPEPASPAIVNKLGKTGEAGQRIQSYLLRGKVAQTQKKNWQERGDLAVIEKDIESTESEQQYRQGRISMLEERLAAKPPVAPNRVGLSLGETFAGLVGAVAGDVQGGVNAAYAAADKRQKVDFENDFRSFSLGRENDLRQLDREDSISQFLRAQRANLGGQQAQIIGGVEDRIAGQDWELAMTKMQQGWNELQTVRNQNFQLKLDEMGRDWEMKIRELERADRNKAARIEFTLKGLLATEDEEAIERTVDFLRDVEGFDLGDGGRMLFKDIARNAREQREFENSMTTRQMENAERLGYANIASQQNQDAMNAEELRLRGAGVIGGRGGSKGTEADWTSGSGADGNAPLTPSVPAGLNFDTIVNQSPKMLPEQEAKHKAMVSLRSEYEAALAEDQAVMARKPKASGKTYKTKEERDWEEEWKNSNAKALAALRAWEGARDQFRAAPPAEWGAYVKELRTSAMAKIKELEKDKSEDGKRLAKAVRSTFYQKTGEQL